MYVYVVYKYTFVSLVTFFCLYSEELRVGINVFRCLPGLSVWHDKTET